MDWALAVYPWIKAFHIVAVISWMAGLLYLPRLFIYHCDAGKGSGESETFKIMERRLLRVIINPAMVVSLALGMVLLAIPGFVDWSAWWLHAKLLFVLILLGTHGFFAYCRKNFELDSNSFSKKTYRIVNEVPTLLMITIVVLVVVKPGS